jgi:prepilin-type N-terminal cleavage/methylation domain-containing protein
VNKKAFTLIELLIVVALIGILSSIGVITFQGQIKSSKQKKAEINLNSVN